METFCRDNANFFQISCSNGAEYEECVLGYNTVGLVKIYSNLRVEQLPLSSGFRPYSSCLKVKAIHVVLTEALLNFYHTA